MRLHLASLLFVLSSMVFGCSTGPGVFTGGSGGSGGSGGAGIGGGAACVPNEQIACPCAGGKMGAQVCAADGSGYSTCSCEPMGGSGGSGGGSGSGTTSEPLTCDYYCGRIGAQCIADGAQYDNASECAAICGTWQVGTAGQEGPTLACHLAKLDAMAGAASCQEGGPLGPSYGGPCGTNCENFCSLVAIACASASPAPYASVSDCETKCAEYAKKPAFNATVENGDSLSCRMHFAALQMANPGGTMYCAYVGPVSAACK